MLTFILIEGLYSLIFLAAGTCAACDLLPTFTALVFMAGAAMGGVMTWRWYR